MAADSLVQRAPERDEIPRFDGRTTNIQELLQVMAEALVNEATDALAHSDFPYAHN